MLIDRQKWANNNMPREAYNEHGAQFGSGEGRGFISSYMTGSDNSRKYLVHGHHHGDSDPNIGFKVRRLSLSPSIYPFTHILPSLALMHINLLFFSLHSPLSRILKCGSSE